MMIDELQYIIFSCVEEKQTFSIFYLFGLDLLTKNFDTIFDGFWTFTSGSFN